MMQGAANRSMEELTLKQRERRMQIGETEVEISDGSIQDTRGGMIVLNSN